jgi:hypothetical protein
MTTRHERVLRLADGIAGFEDKSTPERIRLEVGGKQFAWTYNERFHPKKPRRPVIDVLAVKCDFGRREFLVAAAPDRFFYDDHYAGYPGVLVRLDLIDDEALRELLEDGARR